MSAPCDTLAALLSERAAGELDPVASARLDAHLAACAGCREEADALASVLTALALPEPTLEERRALEGLPGRTAAALRRRQRARWGVPAVFAAALAAALVAALLGPGARRHASTPRLSTGELAGPSPFAEPETFDGLEPPSDGPDDRDGAALEGPGLFGNL